MLCTLLYIYTIYYVVLIVGLAKRVNLHNTKKNSEIFEFNIILYIKL